MPRKSQDARSIIPLPTTLNDTVRNVDAEQELGSIYQSLEDCLRLATQEESLFLRLNDYWLIRYHGKAALLRDMRGLHYLAVLLPDPGREFHVRDLLVRAAGVSLARNAELCAGVEVLDAQAKAGYKCRINGLRQELNEAERFNDPQRKIEIQNEIQVIVKHLAYAVGLGGRNRRTLSDAERARSAVTKCIRKAVEKIGERIPSLGCHLSTKIKTGYFCSYNPHPDRPVDWKF